MTKNCLQCKKEFSASYFSILKKKKFCSVICYHKAQIGTKASEETKKKLSKINTGKNNPMWRGGKSYCLECGEMTTRVDAKYCQKHYDRSGEKNPNWKGDNVGYHGLHFWIRKKLGSPKQCESCGDTVENNYAIHWANKSGNYFRDLSDWLRLCVPCHKLYDLSGHMEALLYK